MTSWIERKRQMTLRLLEFLKTEKAKGKLYTKIQVVGMLGFNYCVARRTALDYLKDLEAVEKIKIIDDHVVYNEENIEGILEAENTAPDTGGGAEGVEV